MIFPFLNKQYYIKRAEDLPILIIPNINFFLYFVTNNIMTVNELIHCILISYGSNIILCEVTLFSVGLIHAPDMKLIFVNDVMMI